MFNLIVGFVLGLVVATIGFGGMAKIADKGVEEVKAQAKTMAK